MAYSYFDYEGADTTIQTDILCVSTEHMYALKVLSEDGSNVTLSDVALAATFTKNNAGVLCELSTAPSTKIRVIRSTPYDVLMHDFSNGAQFNADSVDEVYEQLLYLCQEIVEGKLIIDSSGNFGGTSAVCMSQNALQAQLAAEYSRGYSDGKAAGDAAGYARGYSAGEAAGKAAGYSEGEAAGKAVGDAAGYARGYSDGKDAGKAAGYSEGEAAGKAAGDAAGYARGYSEGSATGGSGGGDSGGSGPGGNDGGGAPKEYWKFEGYGKYDVRYGTSPAAACSGNIRGFGDQQVRLSYEDGVCKQYSAGGSLVATGGLFEVSKAEYDKFVF